MMIGLPVQAQRGISYEQLANQQREQNIFIDNFTLPGSQAGTVQFVTTFRIDYNLLPFKKYDGSEEGRNFFSTIGMNIEIFRDPNPPEKRRRNRDFSVEGLEPVDRTFWKDTAYAENYEQTKSKNKFITGKLVSELKPGNYSYILQFTRGEQVDGRTSRKRFVKIKPYQEKKAGHIILAESVDKATGSGTSDSIQLLNFGTNVYYGKDFYAFAHLPGFQPSDNYSFNVHTVDISERDTTKKELIHSGNIRQDQIYGSIKPELTTQNSLEHLVLKEVSNGSAYALLTIPNSRFMNAEYLLEVSKEGQKEPVAKAVFRSRWIEMPTSLLNVNVAIDMLRFIEKEETVRQMKSGSNAEKENKFRAFWEKRDPTPKTEFNELMAEYYRRIDYAYEEFSTINVQGYNTDQGNIYIRFGPPKNIERRFPPGEPAVEIWQYDNRKFVFRAVSGFGEFKLVSN
ncbi:GWxTD domain-containing protein [Aliifodinibius sp. S!AR15-10]|nr:GWxTD domain-containing protein [Aliifodinibius sp. S!AR15-10]